MMNEYSFDETLFRLFRQKPGQEAIPEKPSENKEPEAENNSDKNEKEGLSNKTVNHTK